MKSQKGFAAVLLVAIVAVLAAGGYVYYIKTNTPEPQPQQNQQLVGNDRDTHGCIGSAGYSWCEAKQKCLRTWEEACSDSTTNQTTGWKTYTNKEQGFTLKYPSSFTPDENKNYPSSGDVIVTFRRPSYGDWSFLVAGRYKNVTFDNSNNTLIKDETYQEAIQKAIDFYENKKGLQQKTITVAGKESQEFSFFDKDPTNNYKGDIEHIKIYIPKDAGDYFTFEWKSAENISTTQTAQNGKDQFNSIISTFNLTNLN